MYTLATGAYASKSVRLKVYASNCNFTCLPMTAMRDDYHVEGVMRHTVCTRIGKVWRLRAQNDACKVASLH